MDGGTPLPPSCAQVEGGDQEGPLGHHVGEAAQQESPCAVMLLDDAEDRLDQPLSEPVSFLASEVDIQARWRRSTSSCGPIATLHPISLALVQALTAGHA